MGFTKAVKKQKLKRPGSWPFLYPVGIGLTLDGEATAYKRTFVRDEKLGSGETLNDLTIFVVNGTNNSLSFKKT